MGVLRARAVTMRICVGLVLAAAAPWLLHFFGASSDWAIWLIAFAAMYPFIYRILGLRLVRAAAFGVTAPPLWAYWAVVPLWANPPSLKPILIEWQVGLMFGIVALPASMVAMFVLDALFPGRAAQGAQSRKA
jgi:hypothetical protein